MNIGEKREKALALNQKGKLLYRAIEAGEEPYEKREEATAWIKEAQRLMDEANEEELADAQEKLLTVGMGSLTAGAQPTDDVVDPSRWADLTEYIVAVSAFGNPNVRSMIEAKGHLPKDWETKLLQEAVGASGGFLVPIVFRPELLYKEYEDSIVRPRARIIPMAVPQIQIPSIDQSGTPSAPKSAFFGGLRWYQCQEGATKEEVDLKFRLIDIHVHESAGYIPVSKSLIADSPISVDALIKAQFGMSYVAYADWLFLNGSGTGEAQGVISAGATIQPNRNTANRIKFEDVMAMMDVFQPGAKGVWVIYATCKSQLMQLVDPNGNYLWIPNMRDGLPQELMGYEIIWTEKVPRLGTKGDIGLYDFKYYIIGDRQAPEISASEHVKFLENQVVYRLSARFDGKPWLSAPVKIMPAGLDSISPFVALDVPA